jgi:hypothetical protein
MNKESIMEDKRVVATIVIWIAFGMAVMGTGLGNEANIFTTLIALISALAAFGATGLVWVYGSRDMQPQTSEKSKRESDARTELLLQLLDDDERESLKHRLRGEDYMDESPNHLRR